MSDGFPSPEELPGPQDPIAIEGSGGGVAMPGGGKTAEEEAGYSEASANANELAIGAGVLAVLTFETGGGALVFGLMASAFAAVGQYFANLASDPPKPHEQIVTVEPRVSRPPGMNHPVLSPSGIAVQRAVFTLVTARGLLDALERLGSAQQAGDLNWAVTHYGVASQCYPALVVDLATLSAATHGAGKAISGTAFDVSVNAGAGGLRNWIESPGREAKLLDAMRQSGFSTAESNDALKWWKADHKYSGPATTGSALLMSGATTLYASAQKLAL
jgi:hypothetical protein